MFSKQSPPQMLSSPSRFSMRIVRGLSAFGLALLLILTTWAGSAGAQIPQMRTVLTQLSYLPGSSHAAGYTASPEVMIADADVVENSQVNPSRVINPSYQDSIRTPGSAVGIVDWVEILFVVVADGAGAPNPVSDALRMVSQAGLLLSDGSIVDPGRENSQGTYDLSAMIAEINDGTIEPEFTVPSDDLSIDSATEDLHIVINHRNHLSIMSINPLTESEEVYSYDFTLAREGVFGGDVQGVYVMADYSGAFAMIRGDASQDGAVGPTDLDSYVFGTEGYSLVDVDLSGGQSGIDVDIIRDSPRAQRQFLFN